MDPSVDQRIARVIAARQARDTFETPSSNQDRERRAQRAHVLDELPRFKAKLKAGISTINDHLDGQNVWLSIGDTARSPTSEAIFNVLVDDRHDDIADPPTLTINVDFHGKMHCILKRADQRALLKMESIFEISADTIVDLLVQLLECRYDLTL